MAFAINADWFTRMTAEKAEKRLVSFKFKGPGWYLTKTDSRLVVPDIDPTDREAIAKVWKQTWPVDQVFWFYIWNVPFEYLLFGVGRLPPTRLDER